MLGSLLAVISSLVFAVTGIFTRRAVAIVSDVTLGVQVGVPIGTLFFFAALLSLNQLGVIADFSWKSCLWLSLAGINHYVIGRSLHFKCVQLVGQIVANILNRVRVLTALTLGVTLLGEPLTMQLVAGVVLIIFGVTVTALNPSALRGRPSLFATIPFRAYLYGIGAGFCWGISPIFIKLGLHDLNFPVAGAFISFLAATIVMSPSLLHHQRRSDITSMTSKAFLLFSLQGVLSSSANLLRYMALSLAPASVVSPLISTYPVSLLILSYLFNRKLEIFSTAVIIGTITVVIGSLLLI